jgi:RHS repeat-associated protein
MTIVALLLACSPRELHAQAANDNPSGPAGIFNGNIESACNYDPYTANAVRALTDIVVAGAAGTEPLALIRTSNSRGLVGANVGGFGAGAGWQHNYDWKMQSSNISSSSGFSPTSYSINFPDGRSEIFAPSGTDIYFRALKGTRERIIPLSAGFVYLILADGSKIQFKATLQSYQDQCCPQDGCPMCTFYYYTYQAQAIIDPYGLRTTLSYNTDGTIQQVSEPAGRYLRFTWVSGRIDTVTASDGRSVKYAYGARSYPPGTTVYAVLDSVTYYGDNTLLAHYTYEAPNIPSFGNYNGAPLLKTCDDVMYAGPMKKIAYVYATTNNQDGTAPVVGQIKSENYYDGTNIGGAVSSLTINGSTRTETRGDGPSRTFTYGGTYAGVAQPSNLITKATDFKGIAATQGYDLNTNYINAVTDRNGHTINYTLEPITGRMTQVQFPATPSDATTAGRGTLKYSYGSASCADPNNKDPNNPYFVCTSTDEAGNVTQYSRWPTSLHVKQITYPDTSFETFGYDGYGHVLNHRLTTGGTETFAYYLSSAGDPAYKNGLPKEHRDPFHASGNPDARYDYNTLSRLTTASDALATGLTDLSHTTNYTYNSRGQATTTTLPTDPNDHTRHTIVNAFNTDGTLGSVTDQLGHITSYNYDDYKRVTSVTTPVRGYGDNSVNTTTYNYTRWGTTNPYLHTANFPFIATSPAGLVINNDCDNNFRKAILRQAPGTSDDAWTYLSYDNAGNLTQVKDPKSNTTTTSYDERNRPASVKDALNYVTSFRYDAAGRKASVTRPNGQVITYDTYDAMNRLTQQTATQSPEPNAVTKYTYDPSGGLLQTMTDPNNNVYTYGYDLLNRKTSLTYPDTTTETWTYDDNPGPGVGLLAQFKNRAGKIDTFTHDNLYRLTLSNWNDTVTPDVTYTYDAASRVTQIKNSNATIDRIYFNDNLLHVETVTYGDAIARQINITCDQDGRRARLIYPNAEFYFDHTYTQRGQLDLINDGASGATIANFGYDVNGNLTSRALDNSTSSSFGYDALNRCTGISHALVGTTRTFAYHYDSNNIGSLDWVKRDGNLGDVYDYDLRDQANTVQLNIANPDTTAPGSPNITYDANGNRTAFLGQSYAAVNNLSQYTSRGSSSAVYDPNGNMTTGLDGSIYTYDAQNRLLTAKMPSGPLNTFTYDGLNRQVSRKVGSGGVFYRVYDDGWNLLGEYASGNANAFWAYLYGSGGLVKNVKTNNYYYQDASGSTSHLANSAGALVEWYRYDLQGTPFFYNGSDQSRTATAYGVRHLFTGQQWYSEIGLYDLRNRFYSPDMGRFLQADPIGFSGDAGNLYRYCGNNPLKWSDAMGTQVDDYPVKLDGGGGVTVFGGNIFGPSSADDPFGQNPWGIRSFPGTSGFQFGGLFFSGLGLSPENLLMGGEPRDPFTIGHPLPEPPPAPPPSNLPASNPAQSHTVTATTFAGGSDYPLHSAYGPYGPNGQGPVIDPNLPGAALPFRFPSNNAPPGITVVLMNPANSQIATAPILDVGPWNTRDAYWATTGGQPLAVSQFAAGSLGQNGQPVTNPAGIDLTPATFNALGLSFSKGSGIVVWWFADGH